MKKFYHAPNVEFVAIETEKDILLASSELDFTRDENSEDYGVRFPF